MTIPTIDRTPATVSSVEYIVGEKWEENIRNAHTKLMETLDAGVEKVIEHINGMPEQARRPAAAWWKVAWQEVAEYIAEMVNCICDVGQGLWERVKVWFAKIKDAILRARDKLNSPEDEW